MPRTNQKHLTKQRILAAAGKVFRKSGFFGGGVDGLAKEAGLTSGAFYVHFDSKAQAFQETLKVGLDELKAGLQFMQTEKGADWWPYFVHFYLSDRRTCDLADGCALQVLLGDVSRSDDISKGIFEKELNEIIQLILAGPDSENVPKTMQEAYVALVLLTGGVSISRAVVDLEVSAAIAEAIEKKLLPKNLGT